MSEVILHEDTDVILWVEEIGSPGDPDYFYRQRREVKPGSRTANRETIRADALGALAANRNFVSLTTPTNAQVLAQTKALSRQVNGIIRVLLDQLEGTD